MDTVTLMLIIGIIAMAAIGIGISIWGHLKFRGTHYR